MAKYISAEIAKKALADSNLIPRYAESCKPITDRIIDSLTAADVAPVVHGRWEGTADGYADGELVYDMWDCSECGFDADGAEEKPEWKYCPNCGAKMDLEGEN